MKKASLITAYTLGLALIFSTRAEAYIDPATTSYIIQIVVGIVIALGTVVGIYWKKIRGLFKKKNAEEELPTAEQGGIADGEKDVVTAADLLDDDEDKSNLEE